MDKFWTLDSIIRHAGATLHNAEPTRNSAAPRGVCIDSRALVPDQVFIALKGENVDGHRFIADAAARGASAAIISNPALINPAAPPGFPLLLVPDPIAAMGRLAAAYRDTLTNTLVIAVTGSAGKTTTTRLIAAALSGGGLQGTHPAKSFNNSIGVPFTILNARPDDDFLVCEVGTSAPGEIDALARIVRPDAAVITSIGRAHAEFLGGVEGVAREKSALLRHFRDQAPGATSTRTNMDAGPEAALRRKSGPGVRGSSGVHKQPRLPLAFIPTQCDSLNICIAGVPNLARFGRGPHADIPLGRVEMTPDGVRFQIESTSTHAPAWFSIPMLGEHNATNAAAAVGVARWAGLTDDQIRRGLATAKGASMRLERRRIAGIDIINDAYNANPESMKAAIATLAAITPAPGGRRVLILGDMLELGEHSAAAHAEVVSAVSQYPDSFGLIVAVGKSMTAAARAGSAQSPLSLEPNFNADAAERIASLLRPADVVLLKGSRGMRVELVATALERRSLEMSGA